MNTCKSSYWRPYMLEVKGYVAGIEVFSNSTRLRFNPKGLSTFIQTDKLNYRPGQEVKIRAVSIHPDGKPQTSPADIIIKDPRGNMIRQWLNLDSVLGVVSKRLQLSENPPLGKWTIVTTVNVSFRHLNQPFCKIQNPIYVTKVSLAGERYQVAFDDYSKILRPSLNFTAKVRLAIFLTIKIIGQIISAGKSNLPLILVPDSSWAPEVCIVVYCVHSNGEVINDAIQLPITWLLQNQVSLSWSEADRKPAEPVSLRVSVAEPGSLVGILVVDKAARLNGSHNDITKETVRKTIEAMYVFIFFCVCAFVQTCDLVVLTDTREGVQLLAMTAESDTEQQEEPRERWNFPETWLKTCPISINLTVPDSITTWSATAFVVSESLGLGVVETPAELTVFQDFFLSLNLPAYIVRGEELVLEVLLFNYLPQDLEVMVIVAESDTFQFVFPDNEALSMASVRRLSVPSQGAASVLIPIKPLVLGEIPVSVKAVSSAASDAVRRAVLVKPEGVEQWFSTSLFLELAPPETSLSRDITFTFPADVVAGSERAHVTAVGDILAPSIAGLGSLVRMPYGCGEQNMINFAPNIYVLRYLTATGQADVFLKSLSWSSPGYERQLSFQRADGSFSAFGDSDPSGSSWLSAFVLRCFLQARSFVFIQQEVVQRAAAWLAAQQGADGSFEEPGRVIHTALQGGLDGPVALTAYVLIDRYASQVSEALMFLETRLALSISSNYSLSLLSYALALAGSSSANAAVSELIGRADVRDGVPFWSSLDAGLSASWQPRSADIEMASYVLLALHELGNITANLGLVKWLSRQRNDLGGYGTLMRGAHLSLFSFSLFSSQLNVFYNVDARRLSRRRRDAAEHEAFDLDFEISHMMFGFGLVSACRLLPASGLYATGMAVLEVGLLSGFGLAQDGVRTGDVIKRVETPPRKVVLYLDSVTREKMCVRLPLVMEHKVAKVQDAAVVIYDYYEPRKTAPQLSLFIQKLQKAPLSGKIQQMKKEMFLVSAKVKKSKMEEAIILL
uniref:CD109 molecule n=1 Tax=Myripristis murdjan TaxID=586833 RepID=A0A667Y5Q2_9TELE